MSGLRYSDIANRPREVLELTSLTVEEFEALVSPFEEAFKDHMSRWRIDGKPRTERSYSTYRNCPLPAPEDRLLFVLVYLKNNPIQYLHGRMFGLPQGKANMWLHLLLCVLRATLSGIGESPGRSMEALARTLEAKGDPPLFVTTAPRDPSRAPRTLLNRRASIAARKSATA